MTKHTKPARTLPTREQIKTFIEESSRPVGRREVARAFNLKGPDRIELKRLIRDLVERGDIDPGDRRKVSATGRLPSVAVVKVISINDDAEAVARPVSRTTVGKLTEVLLPHVNGNPSFSIGDRILARLSHFRGGIYRGSVVRRLETESQRVVGVLKKSNKELRLVPSNGRRSHEAVVAKADAGEARAGDIVSAKLLPGRRMGSRKACVIEVIGRENSPKAISLICINENEIPDNFSPDARELAEKAKPATLEDKREDLRHIPLITIDGPDARDFDDAVWAEADTSTSNQGGWRLLVAIADVAHYVRPNDALDVEARKRGNSVYFPDRVVPMLPETLSNGLCSLKPGEDRACLVVEITIDAKGRKTSHRFQRALMRSVARVTYEEIQEIQDRDPQASEGLAALSRPLFGAFRALVQAREKRGALEIEIPEMRVVVADDGTVEAIKPHARLDSHRLIEEFMIQANVAAAEALQHRKHPCVYRVHDRPAPKKFEELRVNLSGFDIQLSKGQVVHSTLFNRILEQARGKGHQSLVNELVLRAQSQAVYTPHNIGHFGLALRRYAHFTSPIRRYSDLLVHRALIDAHNLGSGGDGHSEPSELEAVCEHISMTERRATAAERSAINRYSTLFMADRIGEQFDSVVSGVVRFGLFVTLEGGQADALLLARNLPDDYYDHDRARHELLGRHSGMRFRLGHALTVRLKDANLVSGRLEVDYVAGGEANRPRKRIGLGTRGKPKEKSDSPPRRGRSGRKKTDD